MQPADLDSSAPSRPRRRRTPLVAVLLGLLVAGTAAHAIGMLVGRGPYFRFADQTLYYLVLVGGGLVVLLRAVLVRRNRLAWALLGVGSLCWAAGDVLYALVYANDPNPPYPSFSELLYLLDYPLSFAGVLVLAGAGARRLRGAVALDGAIAALGAAALGAALLGPAFGEYASKAPAAAFADIAYPVGDIMIVGAIAAAAVALGWRRDFVLLALGLGVMTLADSLYLHAEVGSGYVEGTLMDTLWALAATLLAFAAWQPAGPADEPERQTADERSIALPCLIAIVAVGLLVTDHFSELSTGAMLLAGASLLLAVARLALAFAENTDLLRGARHEAVTDALTGLGNRRLLMEELEQAAERARRGRGAYLFAIYDLDGFKGYNDSFGHAAGDMLLRRMGGSLADAVRGRGRAYRLGGDEFCILAPLGRDRAAVLLATAGAALSEDGEAFSIGASKGTAMIPAEAGEVTDALRLADRRLYADKGSSPRAFERQARDLLLGVLREREPDLGTHMEGVGALAVRLGRRAGLSAEQLDVVGRAGELHDIGKMAIPDEILAKPGPLDEEEWRLMRNHTLIGERILSTAPALLPVARLVRSSHERWDGGGYPDGLRGEKIPLGARVIAICDAFEAMTEDRPYRGAVSVAEALAEIERNAGTQFDSSLVEVLAAEIAEHGVPGAVELSLDARNRS